MRPRGAALISWARPSRDGEARRWHGVAQHRPQSTNRLEEHDEAGRTEWAMRDMRAAGRGKLLCEANEEATLPKEAQMVFCRRGGMSPSALLDPAQAGIPCLISRWAVQPCSTTASLHDGRLTSEGPESCDENGIASLQLADQMKRAWEEGLWGGGPRRCAGAGKGNHKKLDRLGPSWASKSLSTLANHGRWDTNVVPSASAVHRPHHTHCMQLPPIIDRCVPAELLCAIVDFAPKRKCHNTKFAMLARTQDMDPEWTRAMRTPATTKSHLTGQCNMVPGVMRTLHQARPLRDVPIPGRD